MNISDAEKERMYENHGLVTSADGRTRISRHILKRYCREVYYDPKYKEGETVRSIRHRAIGFPNSGGGATMMTADGSFTAPEGEATRASVAVFEGFMDFLSWITNRRPAGVPGDMDIVVLNSTANLEAALPFILRHRNAVALLDGDETGSRATKALLQACEKAGVRGGDRRDLLKGYNGYNEMWQAECRKAA